MFYFKFNYVASDDIVTYILIYAYTYSVILKFVVLCIVRSKEICVFVHFFDLD